MLAILIDIHEPEAIADELRKTLTVVRSNNEPIGYADYLWNTGHYKIMVERKQGGELLSSIGGRLDTQLLKYQEAHPDAQIVILQEGHITPTPDNRCMDMETNPTKEPQESYMGGS